MKGLTATRTGRLVASFFAILGMLFMLLNRVLTAVVEMAGGAVQMGLARYNNFTGRFAAENFAEDKQLLAVLKEAQQLLPLADTALAILMVLSVVFIAIAVVGMVMPKNLIHVLVAVRLLKWVKVDAEDTESRGIDTTVENIPLTPKQKKIALASIGGVVALLFAILGISSCVDKVQQSTNQNYVADMQEQALTYIKAQKEYFGKNKKVGSGKQLNLPDSLDTDGFHYKTSASRFTATSRVQMGNCPAGSKWSVSSSTKGFFTQELQLLRIVPKDTACANLTPDFKQLGRKKKN